jgi:hypothetical protein
VALFAAAPLVGHSFWPTFYSSKTAVSVAGDELQVAEVIEIPTASLLPKFRKRYRHLDLKEEIEAGRFDALEEQFKQELFATMGEGLSLEVDGRAVAGSWEPADTPMNGRASEGFFVYLLEFEPAEPWQLGERVRVRVTNDLYRDRNIVLANYVETGPDWTLLESSSPQPPPGADLTVGAPAELEMWSQDPEYRDFRVVLERTP